jgi:uncharacterized protein
MEALCRLSYSGGCAMIAMAFPGHRGTMADVKLVVVALAFGLASCAGSSSVSDRPPSEVTFDGSEAVLYVEIADDPTERRRGLMGVHQLPDDEGMAFVFEEPVTTGFWMKDTHIPLSIAFVGEDDRVVGIREMEPCAADPCPSYGPTAPYVLAIEANSGWFEEHEVAEGDRARLEEQAYQ